MAVVVGGVGDDESLKLGGKEVLVEAAAGATTGASPGERWSAERLSGGRNLVSGQGRCGINLSYARPNRGGRHTLAEEEEKREVGANGEEV